MMKLMLLIGIHSLLMLVYAAMVATGHSRMRWLHLLMALPLPLIGELCLLMAELDSMPASPLYTSPFRRRKPQEETRRGPRLPEDWKERLYGEETSARAFLLDVIGKQSEGLTTVLQEALHVPGSEVCHIAASTLMKLHSHHEAAIVRAQHRFDCNSSMPHLRELIDAVDTYRVSGLNNGASLKALEDEEITLLRTYLKTMKQDIAYRTLLVQLLTKSEPQEATMQARQLVKLQPEEPDIWRLALRACRASGDAELLSRTEQELDTIAAYWPKEKRDLLTKWGDDDAERA